MGNKVYILRYLRKGLVNNLQRISKDLKTSKRAQIDINLKFWMKHVDSRLMEEKVLSGQTIELLGPADVKSVNSKAISRVSPAESGDVRLNASYRPYVEFYEEDLPWRYTPFAPGSPSGFYPWMRLIAVKTDECTIAFKNAVKIARINLTAERIQEVFATPEELAKSAHAQIDVEDDFQGTLDEATVNRMLDENPDCGISRVLCTSKLEPGTEYVVLLIPTYEHGRLSALGKSLDGAKMNDLVTPQPGTDFELPIYYKWKCTTASRQGTFKDLADKLNITSAADYEKMDSNLTVDISQSGLKTVSYDGEKKIDVPAALVMSSDPYSNLEDEGKQYRTELQKHLSLNPVFDENELEDVNQEEDPWVVPPVYGARHLMTTRKDFEKGPDAGVVNEVNLKLHNRIAAGLGGSVVMKNQESFVNRAWQSVEVVNALNQMLREYYQMNEVNECAKDKNNRSSIDKSALNKQNEGLISDAAMRMLQTSGIYYNNKAKVDPDTLLEDYKKMSAADSGLVSSGLTKDYLASLYAPDLWQKLIDQDKKIDAVNEQIKQYTKQFSDNNAWNLSGMSDIDFLQDIFETKVYNGEVRFMLKSDAVENMRITPDSLVMSSDFGQIFNLVCASAKTLKEIKMTDLYNSLKGLKDRYETFNEAHIPSFPVFGKSNCKSMPNPIYPYAINVMNSFGVSFIVPDKYYEEITIDGKHLNTSPLAIKYYLKNDDESPSYLFIVPKTFLKFSLSSEYHRYYMRYLGYFIELEIAKGQFSIPHNNRFYSLREFFVEYEHPLYKHIKAVYDWMKDNNIRLYKEKPKIDKKCSYKDFEAKLLSDGFKTHLKGKIKIDNKQYDNAWLCWDNGEPASSFSSTTEDNKRWDLDIPLYRGVVNDIINSLEDFVSLIFQPTDVEFDLSPIDARCINIDPNVYYKALIEKARQDKDVVGEMNKDLQRIKDEVVIQKGKIEEEFKLVPKDAVQTESVEAAVIDVIDPDQLAKDRIKELQEKYGVTEFNQLEDRLCDKYPVMVHPDFLDPTYFYLRELSVDYVLPASGSLAKNSISCFYSNQAFEEAFLLGMNTEMGRELMWREYPTDQRGSYFRKFWDQTELPKKEDLKKRYYDIEDIDKWKNKLGKNHRAGKSPMLVFAIKGDLMQTYPDTDVYLQKIGAGGKPADEIVKQEMASWLTPDTYLVGFSGISKEDLKNYYLVFRQRPLSLQFSKESENQSNPYGIVNPQCYLMVAAQ